MSPLLRPLGEVAEKVVVGHVGPTSQFYTVKGVPFLRTQNVGQRQVIRNDIRMVTQEFHARLKKSQINAGDVILSRVISDKINCAVVPKDLDGANCANIIVIRPGPQIDAAYLCHLIATPETQRSLMKSKVGSAQSVVNTGIIKAWEIPFPPLPEQRRIAAILDKADGIRRKRQETIGLTEEFLRSAFLNMFGDPVTNPKGWPTQKLGSVLEDIQGGWSAKGEDRSAEQGEWGVLKISAVTSGRFRPSENKVVAQSQIERRVLTPERGDLLFSRANTRELVAATCLVEEDRPQLFLPDKLWKLVPTPEIVPEYLRFVLADRKYRTSVARHATGTSGSMLNVSKEKLCGMTLPVPDQERQDQFKRLVWKTYTTRSRVESAAVEADYFFGALVGAAFRGDL